MEKGVAVTGMGIVSAIGNNVAENFASLLAGKSGLSSIEILETRHSELPSGEVKIKNEELASHLNLPKNTVFPRSSLLGIIAAKEAMDSANPSRLQPAPYGLISATTVGGMDLTEKYYPSFWKNKNLEHVEAQHAGFCTHKIAEYLGITGFVTTISTACSSSANAIILGTKMIKNGKLDRLVVGGTDCLSKFTLNGFNSLMLLSEPPCKPFDQNRNGLNLGEAAAYLVLESDEIVERESKKPLAWIGGCANANDAFHQTASSEEGNGAFLAMQKAIESAGITLGEIGYINAHGTATPNNDLSESRAMERLFGKGKTPLFSSTKAFTGHTLAAAGAVEAVFGILALRENLVFPNLNFSEKMKETNLAPQTEIKSTGINHVLSNSFGFGGNCSSLIFSKE